MMRMGKVSDTTFQSTPSAWRETIASIKEGNYIGTFQSTPSAWRETNQI